MLIRGSLTCVLAQRSVLRLPPQCPVLQCNRARETCFVRAYGVPRFRHTANSTVSPASPVRLLISKDCKDRDLVTRRISVRYVHVSSATCSEKLDRKASDAAKTEVQSGASSGTQVAEPRWVRFKRVVKREALHYWHGSKLLWIDMKIASSLLSRMAAGEQLTRRERRQLARTTADMFR